MRLFIRRRSARKVRERFVIVLEIPGDPDSWHSIWLDVLARIRHLILWHIVAGTGQRHAAEGVPAEALGPIAWIDTAVKQHPLVKSPSIARGRLAWRRDRDAELLAPEVAGSPVIDARAIRPSNGDLGAIWIAVEAACIATSTSAIGVGIDARR